VLLAGEGESGDHPSMIEHMFDPVNRNATKGADVVDEGTADP
jgi:hypothetical protein